MLMQPRVVVRDLPSIYMVPMLLEEQGLKKILHKSLNLDQLTIPPALQEKGSVLWKKWKATVNPRDYHEEVTIALVGKYIELPDSYLSVCKALEHSAMRVRKRLNLTWVDSEHLEEATQQSDPAKFHKSWHDLITANGM